MEFIVELENDSKREIYYPSYYNYDDMEIIEPMYDNLKLGEKVKFKIKSDLKNIFIYNDKTNYNLEKNQEGYFEKEIIIKGDMVSIGKRIIKNRTENGYIVNTSIVISYKVIN